LIVYCTLTVNLPFYQFDGLEAARNWGFKVPKENQDLQSDEVLEL
jgi:hypothetical protein